MVWVRVTVFREDFLAGRGFLRFFEFGDFSAEAFFAVSRAAFDFVFFIISILPDISVFL